jgi:mono/diheme cytochrome c family protein
MVGLLAGLSLLASTACAQQMAKEPRYKPLEGSGLLANGQSALDPPADTVARGHLQDDRLLFTGMENGAPSTRMPFPVTKELLVRGQQRFDVYCAVCHGQAGDGRGMLPQRGFAPPPSYHTDALRQQPIGFFFVVATNGIGSMPSYAAQIPVVDRWAIAAYIRALQLSQNAQVSDVPPDARAQLEAQP